MSQCSNSFLEPDGFCNACGANHHEVARKQHKLLGTITLDGEPKKNKRDAVIESVDPDDRGIVVEAISLLQLLGKEKSSRAFTTRISKKRKSCVWKHKDGKTKIILGLPVLKSVFEIGFQEYYSVEYLIEPYKKIGLAGIKLVILHEYAHQLNWEQGTTDHHGENWRRIYQNLLQEYAERI